MSQAGKVLSGVSGCGMSVTSCSHPTLTSLGHPDNKKSCIRYKALIGIDNIRTIWGIYPIFLLASLCSWMLNARTLTHFPTIVMLLLDMPRRTGNTFVLQSPRSTLGKGALTYLPLSSLTDTHKILETRSARKSKETGTTS